MISGLKFYVGYLSELVVLAVVYYCCFTSFTAVAVAFSTSPDALAEGYCYWLAFLWGLNAL